MEREISLESQTEVTKVPSGITGDRQESMQEDLTHQDTEQRGGHAATSAEAVSPAMNESEVASSSYGPIRTTGLGQALRKSLDLLDMGNTRVPRTPYDQNKNAEDVQEVYLAQKENQEIHEKDIQDWERPKVNVGKKKERSKLINTNSIFVHKGKEARALKRNQPAERFLESRFVKTKRADPENPGQTEIKCRWCVKGFRDPDLMGMMGQSPTLSLDSFMVVLQILASNNWQMVISDVEGAFLQGEPLKREKGRIFVTVPREDLELLGLDGDCVVELVKCVYGLCDAPRAWWLSFSTTLKSLGMKQSELDPCVFYWHHEQRLQGTIALHVDDMVMGGTAKFHEVVLKKFEREIPF